MNRAMLLDCTLRDGAYLVDKNFGDDVINGMIAGLVDAGTDIVEIGFLQDDGSGPGKTVFLNSREAKKFIPENRGRSMFAVLADFSRYSIDNLDPYDGTSFDAVRICFFKAERYEVLEYFKAVKAKGYKLFVQPVDILGYTDMELLELLELVSPIEPFCFSIVDTFGSMYEEDLKRVFSIVDHNLCPTARIGFHSHNNMQMSGALSQAFLHMSAGLRDVVIDATVSGMGRGAGNTPTELIAQYMVARLQYHYDIDAFLDVIDNYIAPIKANVEWGYSTDMFLTGAYSAHVNNIAYLEKKNSIRSKDIRFILNKIGPTVRKRYHYDLLESTYLDLVSADVDDSRNIAALAKELSGTSVVMVLPGKTAVTEAERILAYIKEHEAVVISVNFEAEEFAPAYLYMSNVNRYTAYRQKKSQSGIKKILTSNIKAAANDNEYIIAFQRLYKCGWQYGDNSAILLLRLLDELGVREIGIAGLDGFDPESLESSNYINKTFERPISGKAALEVNREIKEMMNDYFATRHNKAQVRFITTSRFDEAYGGYCKHSVTRFFAGARTSQYSVLKNHRPPIRLCSVKAAAA